MRKMILVSLFIILTLTSVAQQQSNERFTRVINRLIEAMNKQDYAGIVREYDTGMSAAFPLNKTTMFFKNYESQYGKVSKIDPPQIKATDQAVCVVYFERGVLDLTIYINEQEKIKTFIFTTHIFPEPPPTPEKKPTPVPSSPKTETPPPTVEPKPEAAQAPEKTPVPSPKVESKQVPAQTPEKTTAPPPTVESKPIPTTETKPTQPSATPPIQTPAQPVPPVVPDKQQTELFPPFKGSWTVLMGGELRSGATARNLLLQQYAYEFSAKDSNGLRYKNDGKTNEDYYGYGKDVLAPGNGTIVEAIDGIRENSPGLRNPYAAIGNAIVIQHTNSEYSVFSFLKQGSVRVKVGDKVARGQVIARCGSSGNATEPVIHYHLQDSPYLQTAKGVKFYFERATVIKDGVSELKLIFLPNVGETIKTE